MAAAARLAIACSIERVLDITPVRGMGIYDKTFARAVALQANVRVWMACLARRKVAPGLTGMALGPVVGDRKSTRLNSSHIPLSRMPSSA